MTRTSFCVRWPVVAGVVVVLAVVGYLLLWTTYMVYDDEGYVLYSLRLFVERGHLYDQVYTQYGPFFFVLGRALHALGLQFTNTAARALALTCWLGAAMTCAAIVWRAGAGRIIPVVATLVAAFVHLLPMSSEPSHPGGLITLLVAAAAWCGTNDRWPAAARAGAVGAIGAMLVLTKINVGLFVFIGAGAWWLLNIPTLAARAWVRWGVAIAIGIVPFLLMHGSLAEPWIRMYVIVAGTGAAAAVLASAQARGPVVSGRDWMPALLAAVALAFVTGAVVLHRGTSLQELLEGVVLGPLRHPSVYWVALTWRTGAAWLAAGAIPLAIWLRHLPAERRAPMLLGARLLLLVAYAGCASGVLPLRPAAFVMSYGLTTCWVFVMPAHVADERAAVRSWLALLLVMQALHAFPVAGSQISWGTFLWVPLAVLGAMDLGLFLRSATARLLASVAAAAATALVCFDVAATGWHQYRYSDELGVRGAEHLRLPESYTTAVRMLVRNGEVHAGTLFTLPGMMSFNAWTGVPPPTTVNATHWFNLLSAGQQDEIQKKLQATPDAALIVQRYVYDLVNAQHFIHPTPLLDWLLANYSPAFKVGTYEFWVPKGRSIAPVNAVRLFADATGAPLKYKLVVTLAPDAPVTIATAEVREFQGDVSVPVALLTNRNARFFATAISPAGERLGAIAECTPPFPAERLVQLEIFTNSLPATFGPAGGVVYFRDASGRRVAEARLIN